MAIWGPKLYESDCTSDIRDAFHNLIDSGIPPDEVKQQILNSFSEVFLDQDEGNAAKLALADLMWSVGTLTDSDKADVLTFLQEGGDISFWEENAPHLAEA